MERCLKVKFPNGDLFSVPASVVAENRADYYSTIDGYEIGSNEWQNEVEYALNDEYELKDWMLGNMDWPDLESHATLIEDDEDTEFDYENGFTDSEIELCNDEINDKEDE